MVRHAGESDHSKNKVSTELSILPGHPISIESYKLYERHNNESPMLKPNQLSIYGIELSRRSDESVQVTALVRSSVQKEIRLAKSPILLIGAHGRPLARHVFDLQALGSLPPNSARPWTFIFPPESFLVRSDQKPNKTANGKVSDEIEFNLSSWALAFERKRTANDGHQLDLSNTNGLQPSPKIRRKLKDVIKKAPPLGRDEINFMGLSLHKDNQGGLIAILLIRNGMSRDITLQQVPLEVMDANKEVVARGTFKLEDLIVKANTSKPVRFVFPASGILKEDMDLSKWKIYHVDRKNIGN